MEIFQNPPDFTNVIIVSSISIITLIITFLILLFYILSRINNKKIFETWKLNQEKKYNLSFRNISYSVANLWSEKKILNNISGQVPQGKLVAIMGSSGSGKTSLLGNFEQNND